MTCVWEILSNSDLMTACPFLTNQRYISLTRPILTSTLRSVHGPVVARLFPAEALVAEDGMFAVKVSQRGVEAQLVAHRLTPVTQLSRCAVVEVVGIEELRDGGDGLKLGLVRVQSSHTQNVDTCQTGPDCFLYRESLKHNETKHDLPKND